MRYLWILSAFAAIVGVTYFVMTQEMTGTVLLLALATMPLIVGLWLTRHDGVPLPSDDPDTSASEHSGEKVGSFPAVTVWPIFFVAGVVIIGAALIYGLILIPAGLIVLTLAIIGLMQESQH